MVGGLGGNTEGEFNFIKPIEPEILSHSTLLNLNKS
jgi:hypothetical protein